MPLPILVVSSAILSEPMPEAVVLCPLCSKGFFTFSQGFFPYTYGSRTCDIPAALRNAAPQRQKPMRTSTANKVELAIGQEVLLRTNNIQLYSSGPSQPAAISLNWSLHHLPASGQKPLLSLSFPPFNMHIHNMFHVSILQPLGCFFHPTTPTSHRRWPNEVVAVSAQGRV